MSLTTKLRAICTDDMCVDDLVTGGKSTKEVDKIKGDSGNLFQIGGFKFHNCDSKEQA